MLLLVDVVGLGVEEGFPDGGAYVLPGAVADVVDGVLGEAGSRGDGTEGLVGLADGGEDVVGVVDGVLFLAGVVVLADGAGAELGVVGVAEGEADGVWVGSFVGAAAADTAWQECFSWGVVSF